MTESSRSLGRQIRVMVVDDSALIRSIIEKILKTESKIEIVGFSANGEEAVQTIAARNPDVVILDIEMPIMDGITALPLLLKNKAGVHVIICSTLSARGADISIRALALGASECLLKPSGPEAISQSGEFHTALLRTVLSLGAQAIQPHAAVSKPQPALRKSGIVPLAPKILAIGSSTGGPNALMSLLGFLKGLPIPIVITQHMPKTFTRILAEHIEKASGVKCSEGEEGMVLEAGQAYVAPGGYHMLFKSQGGKTVIALNDGPAENYCKPSVDPMMRSLVEIYGGRILSVILTGMGNDGLAGCRQVTEAGGLLAAQDEETSVVWGMPGAVAQAGICNAILPIPQIADWVLKSVRGGSAIGVSR